MKMFKFEKCFTNIILQRNLNTKALKSAYNFIISKEVMHGLEAGAPVVALESTIITHGMPYPQNMKCALDVEKIVRNQGAIPATIAILGGKVNIGLDYEQICYLANTNVNKSIKTSRRDFSYVLSHKLNGGTTVSSTIIVAEKVGIPVFVTGGIGGVHRLGEQTLDISTDLTELGRNSIAVISSGIKSILDIPRTLEYLETQGVFVATFGDSLNFPAFYSLNSGCQAPYNVSTAKEAAEIINTSLKLNLKSGMLFAVPVPEAKALDNDLLNNAIEQALKEAEKKKIIGKHITPYLLNAVSQITDGQSLETNISLIKNNAKIGAQIAVELSKIRSNRNKEEENIEKKSTEAVAPVLYK